MKFGSSIVVAVAALWLVAEKASATTYTVTYSGNVIYAISDGFYGDILDTIVTGDIATVSYVFDNSLGSFTSNLATDYFSQSLMLANHSNPLTMINVKLGSFSLSETGISAATSAYDVSDSGAAFSERGSVFRSYQYGPYTIQADRIEAAIGTYFLPPAEQQALATPLAQSLHFSLGSSGGGNGIVDLRRSSILCCYTGREQAEFSIDSITVAVAGVPEPATWGLMLAGFGAMGAALRRRRVAAAA